MIKLKEHQYSSILRYLDKYTHSIPIIYSMVEGQFSPSIFVDDSTDTKWGIMFTPFDFHYVFGDASKVDEKALEQLIKDYVILNNRQEAMIFEPDNSFNHVLSSIIGRFKGVKGNRVSLEFNQEVFEEATKKVDVRNIRIKYSVPEFGLIKNPIAYIEKNGKQISYSNALMVGANEAEVDVKTNEGYRRLGYSFKCSVKLINELIAKGLKPNWTAWKKKTSSIALAKKLGFRNIKEIPAYIWVEQFGPLQ